MFVERKIKKSSDALFQAEKQVILLSVCKRGNVCRSQRRDTEVCRPTTALQIDKSFVQSNVRSCSTENNSPDNLRDTTTL